MKQFFTKCSRFHRGWMLVLVMLLSCTSLQAATKTEMKNLGTLIERQLFAGNYDTGSKWWGYQVYTRPNLDLSAYKDDISNLVVTFKLYMSNLDHPGDFSFTTLNTTIGFFELGASMTEAYTTDPKKFTYKEGWNEYEIPLKDMKANVNYSLANPIKWFRFCFAHMKTDDAYLIRIADLCIRDKSQMVEVEDKDNPTYDTTYDVCTLPFSFDATLSSAGAKGLKSMKFDNAYDLSKHNVKQLYVAFDSEITLSDGAKVSTITTGNGQIELTSSGKCDVEEATIGMNAVDWKEGKHTYYVPLASVLGGLQLNNLNFMRVYLVNLDKEPKMVGTIHWTMENVRILDFTTKAKLPTIFSDGMMFQQNKPMNIWGYGVKGKTIKVELSKNGTLLATKTATIGEDGKWTIAFDAQKGSYDKYSFTVYENGTAFQTVNDILVGEVWLSGGQSNMALSVNGLQNADEVKSDATNDNIRIFMEPSKPTGEESPYVPEKDIPGATWGYGNNPDHVGNVSAVAYLTIKELQKKLNIPVGFINTAIGGSVIEAWLSRDVIEAEKNADFKAQLKRRGMYFDKEFWVNNATTMSGFYNAKIGPLAGFNIAGALWYQGESNSGRPELYGQELQMLKEAWGNTFGFKAGEMPFSYNGVATWVTETASPYWLGLLSEAMEDGYKKIGDNKTAYFPIYDTNYSYTGNVVIHPTDKRDVAKHHATALYNMVYDSQSGKVYTAPMMESVIANGDKMVVKFNHVGEGLKTTDGLKDVHGFSIADEDGIYVGARAEITGKDEVTVWNDGVKNPKNVNYAFCSFNMDCNLTNSEGFAASPFRSDRSIDYTKTDGKDYMQSHFYNPQPWTYADGETSWEISAEKITYPLSGGRTVTDYATDFRPTWTTNPVSGEAKATIAFDTNVKAEGKASMKLTYNAAGAYGVGPVSGYLSRVFQFANFKTISVMVKNADNRDKNIQLSFKTKIGTTTKDENNKDVTTYTYYTYTVDAQAVKANADFATVTFDLATLKDDKGAAAAVDVLKNACDVQFTITDNAAGTVYLDNVTFGTYDANELVDGEIRVVGKDADNNDVVTIRRDLKGGVWNTICLPFALNNINEAVNKPSRTEFATYFGEGAKIACIDTQSKVENGVIYFSDRSKYNQHDIVAGRAYLIKPAKDLKVIITKTRTATNVQTSVVKDADGKAYYLTGVLESKNIRTTDVCLGADGNFFHPDEGKTEIKGLRGYFQFPADVALSKMSIGDSSSATGIQDIMLNGAYGNAKIYTLDGRYVGTETQSLSKGVYVIGNKKVVIK